MKKLSVHRAGLAKSVITLALAAVLVGGPAAGPARAKALTAQDLFLGWAKESGLTLAEQKGDIFLFVLPTSDKRDQFRVSARFVNGNWLEGSTAYPAAGVKPQFAKLLRTSHSIHYLCAMASQGRLTEALPKTEAVAAQLLKGGQTSFDAIQVERKTYADDGEMVAQTIFTLQGAPPPVSTAKAPPAPPGPKVQGPAREADPTPPTIATVRKAKKEQGLNGVIFQDRNSQKWFLEDSDDNTYKFEGGQWVKLGGQEQPVKAPDKVPAPAPAPVKAREADLTPPTIDTVRKAKKEQGLDGLIFQDRNSQKWFLEDSDDNTYKFEGGQWRKIN